ncbi:MAG: carboxypeptidase-like regulatory domain-containing protein [Euryarchaeota archaeon]|nr:carboxypeptidase-like regulatory domain-containing protein [Euryarchaeota archaeon]
MHLHRTSRTRSTTTLAGRIGLGIIVVFMLGATLASAQPVVGQVVNGHIEGIVLTEGRGPLGGVEVTAVKLVAGDITQTKETKTDDEGAFAFPELTPGTWNLTFRADGFATDSTVVEVKSGETHQLEVLLHPKWTASGTFLSGTVLDGETGEPVAGVLVELRAWNRQTGSEATRETKSDANGTYHIELFMEHNSVHFTRSGYRTWYAEAWGGQEDQELSPHLQSVPIQSVTVKGRVVDGDGNPVQAQIQMMVDWQKREAGTTSHSDSDGGTEGSTAKAEPARMSIACCYEENWNSTITEKDGTFTMKAYPGHVVIRADRRDHMIAEERLTLEENQTYERTFTLKALPAKSVTLSGKVVDAKAGEAVPNAQVTVQVPLYGDHEWTSTDSAGQYTLQLRPGHSIVSVSYHKDRYYHMVEEYDCPPDADCVAPSPSPTQPVEGPDKEYFTRNQVLTTKADETRTLDIKLQPKPEPSTTLIGYVVDSENKSGVAGAQISIYNQATGDWGSATTDTNGSYKFLVRGGYTTLHVWADGFLPHVIDVQVPASGSERVDLEVTAGRHGQVGWWDPDGYGHHGCYDDGPCTMESTAVSHDSVGEGDDAMRKSPSGEQMEARDMAAGGPSDGTQVEGGAGGLPPYDPDRKSDTFGQGGESKESPTFGFAVATAIGALALYIGLRRERRDEEDEE